MAMNDLATEGLERSPTAIVLRAPGTNCDAEMVRAFALAGARPRLVHIDALARTPGELDAADLIGLPGGFSYGDDIASGRVMAARLRETLWGALAEAATRGVPIIGVCNGFQVLVQLGLLPGGDDDNSGDGPLSVGLCENDSARFIDRWVRLEPDPGTRCVWLRGMGRFRASDAGAGQGLDLPVAHAEGRLVTVSDSETSRLVFGGHACLRYAEPVNGSAGDIAGLCDASGLIFGLMPHPDRFLAWTRHPAWTRLSPEQRRGVAPGLRIFQNAVEHVLASATAV